jgi:hypothetical protein
MGGTDNPFPSVTDVPAYPSTTSFIDFVSRPWYEWPSPVGANRTAVSVPSDAMAASPSSCSPPSPLLTSMACCDSFCLRLILHSSRCFRHSPLMLC